MLYEISRRYIERPQEALLDLAKYFYDKGYNVIVTKRKKPAGDTWSSGARWSWEEVERALRSGDALALVAGPLASNYYLYILDIDDPETARDKFKSVGLDLDALCGSTLCVLTGPRPKGKWICDEVGYCHDPSDKTSPAKHISEIDRGLAIFFLTDRQLVDGSIRRGWAELLGRNYQLFAGRHPSGAYYMPYGGVYREPALLPGDVVDKVMKLFLERGEVGLRDVVAEDVVERGVALCKQWDYVPPPDAREKVINLLKKIWPLQNAAGNRYHDMALFALASGAWWRCVKYEEIASLAREVLDWAVANGYDNARTAEQHFKETVEQVYKTDNRRWSFRRIYDVFEEIYRNTESDLTLEEIYAALDSYFGGRSVVSRLDRLIADLVSGKISREEAVEEARKAVLSVTPLDDVLLSLCDPGGEVELAPFAKVKRRYCTDPQRATSRPLAKYVYVYEYLGDKLLIYKAIAKVYESEVSVEYEPLLCLQPIVSDGEYLYVISNGRLVSTYLREQVVDDIKPFLTKVGAVGCVGERVKILYAPFLNSERDWSRAVMNLPVNISPLITGVDDNLEVHDPMALLRTDDISIDKYREFLRWLCEVYGENCNAATRLWALLTAGLVANVFLRPPAVRHLVYVYGRGGEGKTALMELFLRSLCRDVNACTTQLLVKLESAVKTEAQLRNLLELSTLPAILDEQNMDNLRANAKLLHAAATGRVAGVHASRYGAGFGHVFGVKRVLYVVTNVSISDFIELTRSEQGVDIDSIRRRLLYIEFDDVKMQPAQYKILANYTPPPILPIAIQLARRLKERIEAGEVEPPSNLAELAKLLHVDVYDVDVESSPVVHGEEYEIYVDLKRRFPDARDIYELMYRLLNSQYVLWISPREDFDELWRNIFIPNGDRNITVDVLLAMGFGEAVIQRRDGDDYVYDIDTRKVPRSALELATLITAKYRDGKWPAITAALFGNRREILGVKRSIYHPRGGKAVVYYRELFAKLWRLLVMHEGGDSDEGSY